MIAPTQTALKLTPRRLAFTAYGIQWFAMAHHRYIDSSSQPDGWMAIAFLFISLLGVDVFRRAGDMHSSFVTPAQLYQFMKLEYCASSRNAFDNRLRRLLAHDLLVRHEIPTMNHGVVYSISRAGASELVGRGEYYSGSTDIGKDSNGHVQHALELNDIHLALKQSRTLVRWTPESDIRSRNEFTGIGYVKDYDAVVAVRIDEREYRFALEYERTQKANMRYLAIQKRIQVETDVHHFLYLVANYDLMLFLVKKFEGCRRPVYFGLRQDFLTEGLCLSVQRSHSPVSTTFRAVLTRDPSHPKSWHTPA